MKKLFILALVLLFSNPILAQEKAEKVEITELIKDLIQSKKVKENMKQVWIIPAEYWEVALKDSSYGDDDIIDQINSIFKDFILVSALDIEIKQFGKLDKNEMNIFLKNEANEKFFPIPENEINEDVTYMLNTLKPLLSNMLGQLGDKLEFFVFSNKDEFNAEVLTPLKKGEVTIVVNESDFVFRTPFGSLVKSKYCPIDQEKLNGNWDYCPWHGKKLKN